MNKSTVKQHILSFLIITLGSAIFAVGFSWFFQPNAIASGGLTGFAQIVHHLFPSIPVGATVIVLNIPLFILGWRLIGGKLLIGSLWAMFISSVIIDLLATLNWQPTDPILASIFGGVAMGLSLGLILQQGSTTGGTDLLARLLKLKLAWLPMGKLLLVIDLVVIALVAIAFGELNAALYGAVSMYISSLVLDGVLYGLDNAKVAYIISDHNETIQQVLVHDLDKGVTILPGQGCYSGTEKKVLMCAFKQKEIAVIKAAVKEIDPDAFLIVCNAHEVLGEGFRAYKKDDV